MNPINSLMAVWIPKDEQYPERVAIHFMLANDWHIYWENPGDTGMSTTINGVEEVLYPTPIQIHLPNNMVSYGYEHEVVIFGTNPTDSITVRWLACKADTCIPGKKILTPNKKHTESYEQLWLDLPKSCIGEYSGIENAEYAAVPFSKGAWLVPFSDSVLSISNIQHDSQFFRIKWNDRTSVSRLLWVQDFFSCLLFFHPVHSK